ncbi:hypothetical protein [Actinomadura sp. HBU206391]|uniref:hypothetical protein n=1 Tax=Actinomadura sp. HBU206391 TaxID=2731692 RepID=UPI00164FE99F|nr:hypothetical protein [Actinomadura sp. HBU206391]MBC6462156.1 hypothetical protein [Actinomadura sp. HBU206391]
MRASVLTVLALLALMVSPGVAVARAEAPPPAQRVVLMGVPALSWDHLNARDTPNLWRLAKDGSSGALSVRTLGTVACPIDGWLTVSAGTRAARAGGSCATPPPAPVRSGEGAVVTGFPHMRRTNLESRFQSPVGLLGEALRSAGRCTTAAGPGAALALADAQGRVGVYAASGSELTAQTLQRCPVTAVDIDDVLLGGATPDSVRRADVIVGQILAALPGGSQVLVAGLSDGAVAAGPHLRVAIAAGPGFRAGAHLTSDSTRRDKIVITPDLTATLLGTTGVPVPGEAVGTPWHSGQGRAGEGVADLADQDVAAQTYKSVLPNFFLGLVITQVLFFGLAAVALRRRWDGRTRGRVLSATRLAALVSAAVPVSTYLVNLVPWWSTGAPTPMLLGGIAAADVLIVILALAGPWRRTLLGPGTVVATATALTVGLDLVTGTRLQLYSLMGYSPLVGGRYYGLGNIAFAVFATSVLLTAVGAAQWLLTRAGDGDLERSRARVRAIAIVLAMGLTAMVLDGFPAWGADFGGVIAIVPGLAVTGLMVAEKRVSPFRLASFCGAGGVVVLSIAYLDHLRPPADRTHLGRFFGDLLEGQAGPTVERKFAAMIGTIGNPTLTPIVVAALVFLFLVLRRPERLRASVLDLAYAQAPLLRAGLMGALVTAVVGFGVNDSGIAVLALALVVAVPITLAAGIRALEAAESPGT